MIDISLYQPDLLKKKVPNIFDIAKKTQNIEEFKKEFTHYILQKEFLAFENYHKFQAVSMIRVRDAARVLYILLTKRSEKIAQFSIAQSVIDIAKEVTRPDLTPAFYAELLYLFLGLEGRGPGSQFADTHLIPSTHKGRLAAKERSNQLDKLSGAVKKHITKYISGLEIDSIKRREKRCERILQYFNASRKDWYDWNWQVKNITRNPEIIAATTHLSEEEKYSIDYAKTNHIPFGITPYYLSLMDDYQEEGRDRSIRAQVIPPVNYIEKMRDSKNRKFYLDFMREEDTSPIDLITRRYPAICIFKPFNTCPQICVYCQRNWEIEDAMDPDAFASPEDIDDALKWIAEHPAIHEVLITGGDPLALIDQEIHQILNKITEISTIERVRIGSRTPVTMPMRITDNLVDILRSYQIAGRRQIAVVTHIQHAYEITPDTVTAVNKLRQKGISVYNQLVYTFYVSRRFEAAHLRRLLTLIGVDPYYTFNTKGKEETDDYRVPLARLLQEQKEESRMLPGLSRTDEAVYNVPGLGKNYLRARQHRDLISILPDGARLYEFHPWEKNISKYVKTHIAKDVPILNYLKRLDELDEDVTNYQTIWYYY